MRRGTRLHQACPPRLSTKVAPSVRPQLDLVQGMMDCLYAECVPCITDCVMAELEKLGTKYRVSLRARHVPTSQFAPSLPLLRLTLSMMCRSMRRVYVRAC